MTINASRFTRIATGLLLAGAVIAFAVLHSGPIRAAAASPGANSCGLKGTYGFVGTGNSYLTSLFGLNAGPMSTAGTVTFDGNGNWSMLNKVIVINGEVDQYDLTLSGTYTVNPDCTFTAGLTPNFPNQGLAGAVVDQGNQIRAISTIGGYQLSYESMIKVKTQ